MIKKFLAFSVVLLLLSSCTSPKDVVYFQNIESVNTQPTHFESTIKPDDLLMISVMSTNQVAAIPFNLPVMPIVSSAAGAVDLANTQVRYQSYLVDKDGFIVFPVIGKLKLGGLKKAEAHDLLDKELKKYITDPLITIRITNYKISVLGEVLRPSSFPLASERITLPEALGLAGDMTIYGDRHNVLIIRENNGVKTYNYVDMTKSDFFESPFYYLSQNDVVYVRPNKTKVNSASVGPNTTVIISSVSLLITVIALIVR